MKVGGSRKEQMETMPALGIPRCAEARVSLCESILGHKKAESREKEYGGKKRKMIVRSKYPDQAPQNQIYKIQLQPSPVTSQKGGRFAQGVQAKRAEKDIGRLGNARKARTKQERVERRQAPSPKERLPPMPDTEKRGLSTVFGRDASSVVGACERACTRRVWVSKSERPVSGGRKEQRGGL